MTHGCTGCTFFGGGRRLADARLVRLSPHRSVLCAFIVLVALAAGGCADEPVHRRQPTPRASDKAALYGDAALLPTRAGERARNEVALAEEIRAAIEALHTVERARVTVATDSGGAPRSAVVVVRAHTSTNADDLTASATRISRAALGSPELAVEVQVSAPVVDEAAEDVPTDTTPRALLLFGVLGLGISLGLTFDRATGILRRRRVG